MLKILQINLNRSRTAHDLLVDEVKKASWDIVIAVYIQPNINNEDSDKILTEIEQTLNSNKGKVTILAGDFNA
ncbi:UNVERIFIED_CONTAM: hypothetical protein PYX00_006898 [Menopon gallinae]|uniref:Endonuclease/exonuclease/phosphatase domain-containing protein n=1 Tax=Menopon gallinae TaxID=328185 RepID=A0AAW2HX68_9NEOP